MSACNFCMAASCSGLGFSPGLGMGMPPGSMPPGSWMGMPWPGPGGGPGMPPGGGGGGPDMVMVRRRRRWRTVGWSEARWGGGWTTEWAGGGMAGQEKSSSNGGRVVCRNTNGQAIQSDLRNNISEGKLFTSIACCVAGVALEPTARNRPVVRSQLDKHRPTSPRFVPSFEWKPLFVFSIFGRLTMCAHHATSAPLFQRTT